MDKSAIIEKENQALWAEIKNVAGVDRRRNFEDNFREKKYEGRIWRVLRKASRKWIEWRNRGYLEYRGNVLQIASWTDRILQQPWRK